MFKNIILTLIKENHRSYKYDYIAKHLISDTFKEDAKSLSDGNLNSLNVIT
jgi:hypothetical protein